VCVCVPFLIKHSKCHPQGRQLIDVSVGERGRTVHSATNNCWSLLMTRAVAWHQSIITHTHSLRICTPFQSVYLFIYSDALFVFGRRERPVRCTWWVTLTGFATHLTCRSSYRSLFILIPYYVPFFIS
jgi:hypothetical protein